MQEKYDHPYFGEITLFKSREDGKQYMMKERRITSDKDKEQSLA